MQRVGTLPPGAPFQPIVMWFSTDSTPGAEQAAHPTVLRSCQSRTWPLSATFPPSRTETRPSRVKFFNPDAWKAAACQKGQFLAAGLCVVADSSMEKAPHGRRSLSATVQTGRLMTSANAGAAGTRPARI